MGRYRVIWEVELDAETPEAAAAKAFADVYCKPDAPKQVQVYRVESAGRPIFERSLTPTAILNELLGVKKGET